MGGQICGGVVLAIWLYLACGHGGFWRTSIELPPDDQPDDRPGDRPDDWPSVVAVVAARDEAAVLPETLPSLLAQDYPGSLRVMVVDDDSTDGTGELASRAGAAVVAGTGPPAGWTGKVAAMAAGARAAGEVDYLLFTDADIAFTADAVRRLVTAAAANDLVLTSQMVRLRTETAWERLLIPAFVYFFGQLYPFSRVNAAGRVAAAAGGCMLVRRAALERAGGLAEIRGAVIDDVALARLLKPHGRIWLGLGPDVYSVRAYPRLGDLWQMVARSAYTQLRRSPVLLVGTVAGLLIGYLLPPALTLAGAVAGEPVTALLGGAAWLIMAGTYAPMLRWYRLNALRAPLLPVVALIYAAMTVDSARRHHTGRGAEWKGRVAAK